MRNHPNAVMIFAAGFGTRMGVLTRDRPKPLIHVSGKALLDHAIAPARAAGLGPIVVNAHYKADQIALHLADTECVISDESGEILETGGGLRKALPLLGDGAVFTMNADAVWTGPNPFETLRQAWHPEHMDALLLCVPLAGASGHTPETDLSGNAVGQMMREQGLVYCGAQIINPALLNEVEEPSFSLRRAWNIAAERGSLHSVIHQGSWCDVGTPEGIAEAETLLREASHV